MALIIPGTTVSQISGRLGGVVFARNRSGSYVRNGTSPITSTTEWATSAKARMTAVSQAWQSLTTAQRTGWGIWAQNNLGTNRLGQPIVLAPHTAYVRCNARLMFSADTAITDPPILPAPAPLSTLVLTADLGLTTFDVAFTPAALGADDRLYIRAALVNSAGIDFVENILKTMPAQAKATASPIDLQTMVETRFGTIQVGQKLIVEVSVLSSVTGLLSEPLRASAIVVETVI